MAKLGLAEQPQNKSVIFFYRLMQIPHGISFFLYQLYLFGFVFLCSIFPDSIYQSDPKVKYEDTKMV